MNLKLIKSLNKKKGDLGEKVALEFLKKIGFHIIKTNFRKRRGEVDIITADDGGILSFIEVKSRYKESYGKPIEAVNNKKISNIIEISKMFLLESRMEPKSIRYGIISIEFLENNSIKLIYFENAFD